MPRTISLRTLMLAADEEVDGYNHYMQWYRATKNRKFLRMAKDEKKHSRILFEMATGKS